MKKPFELLKARVTKLSHQHRQKILTFCWAGNVNQKFYFLCWTEPLTKKEAEEAISVFQIW